MEPIKPIKPTKIQSSKSDHTKEKLTSVELGKLWVTYTGNTMAKCVLSYYLTHVDDEEIKQILQNALQLTEEIIKSTKGFMEQEGFPLPIGFTHDDVNLGAPRLFADEFYLHYLRYTSKAGMSIYSIAIPILVRADIREFFIKTLNSTIKLIEQVNEVMIEKGLLDKPPIIPIPEKVEFVEQKSYFKGFFGDVRPLHALEIAHLYDNIDNNITSKTLLMAFSQVAKSEAVKNFMLKGKDITGKHIEACSKQLNENNLPSPSLLGDLITTSTYAPFSDKLLMWHKIDMFSMKIRSYANAISLNGRRDIGTMYARFLMDIAVYVQEGANIMVDNGWLEEPPHAIDRASKD